MIDAELASRVVNHLRELADKIEAGNVELLGFDVQIHTQDADIGHGAMASLYTGLMTLRLQTKEVETWT